MHSYNMVMNMYSHLPRYKYMSHEKEKRKKNLSNPRPHTWTRMLELAFASKECHLEFGALDHSATLTAHIQDSTIGDNVLD